MLITVSFPILDCRRLLAVQIPQIDIINESVKWMNGNGFVRSFGGIKTRRPSSESLPINDDFFFTAKKGIHFHAQEESYCTFECVFRRLFVSDYSARLDIGLTPQKKYEDCWDEEYFNFWRFEYACESAEQLANRVLRLTVYGNNPDDARKKTYLRDFRFSKAYVAATTPTNCATKNEHKTLWFYNQKPVVVIVCRNIRVDKRFTKVELPVSWGIDLYYKLLSSGIPLWVIRTRVEANKERVRSLRIWLLKWHQEKCAFLSVFSLISNQQNRDQQLINVSEFATCLRKLLHSLAKKSYYGVPNTDVANTIASVSRQIEPNVEERFINFLEQHEETKYLIKRTYAAMSNNWPFKELTINGTKPVIFISHTIQKKFQDKDRSWVCSFAAYLERKGFITILDQINLPYGIRLPEFMEQAFIKSDYVFCICTPEYKQKADDRSGGVGYETAIITGLVYENHSDRRFYPIFKDAQKRVESTPLWAVGLFGVALEDGDYRNNQDLEDLLKELKAEFSKKKKHS